MRTKMKLKTATDLLMSVALLLLMAYEQIGGQATHEWIGMGMFVLFILGVSSIREFALPLMAGIICGGYSSVCITGALWYVFKVKFAKK